MTSTGPIRILLVDHEPSIRRLLRRWIERFMDAEISEAADGLQALQTITSGSIEMVIADIQMPVLDGIDLLNLLRADPARQHLEFLVATQDSSETVVRKAVELGVSDYLLKPLHYERVMGRIQLAAERVLERRSHQSEEGDQSRARILVADPDPNYCSFAEATLENEFVFMAVRNVADSLVAALKWKPDIVLISPKMEGMQIDVLIQRLRSIQSGRTVQVFLLGDKSAPEANSEHIDGVVARTFVPETLRAEINSLLTGSGAPMHGLLSWVGSLDIELVTALQQALGMMAGAEATILDEAPQGASCDLFGLITITAEAGDFELQLVIRSGQDLAAKLWSAMLGGDEAEVDEDNKFDSLQEILNVVAGRIKNSCLERKIEMNIGLPDVRLEEHSQPPNLQHEAVRHCLWAEDCYFELSLRAFVRSPVPAITEDKNYDASN